MSDTITFHSSETGATYSFEMESWPRSFFHYVAFLRSLGFLVHHEGFFYENEQKYTGSTRKVSFNAADSLYPENTLGDWSPVHEEEPVQDSETEVEGGQEYMHRLRGEDSEPFSIEGADRGTSGEGSVGVWFDNKGDSPDWLNPEDLVEVELRNGHSSTGPARSWFWELPREEDCESNGDILRYRLVKRHNEMPPAP